MAFVRRRACAVLAHDGAARGDAGAGLAGRNRGLCRLGVGTSSPTARGARAAIVLCLPITPLLELGAGFCFGVPAGIATVWAAKSVASVATYGIASVARPARLAAATEKVLMEQPRLRAIADDVQARGKEFTLLARLSPVPSWANNGGLALAGVEFEDYACRPPSPRCYRPRRPRRRGQFARRARRRGGDSSPALIALSRERPGARPTARHGPGACA